MNIRTPDGIRINCLPEDARCTWCGQSPEYMSNCPIRNFDDFGLEYRWIGRFVTGQITYNEMHEKLYTEICRFAKRQMTWFKKYCNVIWLNDEKQIIEMVDKFLKEI